MSKSNQSTFHNRDWAYSSFVDRPGYGILLKDVMEDAYWSNVAAKLKVGSVIEVMPEGLTYYARLIVIDCGPTFAKVKALEFVDLTNAAELPAQAELATEVPVGEKFKAERAGDSFRVKRVADNEVMKDGFRSMAAARKWAAENLKVEA
jgi:hypothetical protein